MNPDELIEIGKSWGPLGIIAWLMLQAYLKRSPDHGIDHDTDAISELRKSLMAEFKDLSKQMGELRDRISRIEGALSRSEK